MTLAITYLGIINLVSFGCVGMVCFILFYLNCKVRLERDQYKEEAESMEAECGTYCAQIDQKNKEIAFLRNPEGTYAHARYSEGMPGKAEVVATCFVEEGYNPHKVIRRIYFHNEEERQLALNLCEELADKINEQI